MNFLSLLSFIISSKFKFLLLFFILFSFSYFFIQDFDYKRERVEINYDYNLILPNHYFTCKDRPSKFKVLPCKERYLLNKYPLLDDFTALLKKESFKEEYLHNIKLNNLSPMLSVFLVAKNLPGHIVSLIVKTDDKLLASKYQKVFLDTLKENFYFIINENLSKINKLYKDDKCKYFLIQDAKANDFDHPYFSNEIISSNLIKNIKESNFADICNECRVDNYYEKFSADLTFKSSTHDFYLMPIAAVIFLSLLFSSLLTLFIAFSIFLLRGIK